MSAIPPDAARSPLCPAASPSRSARAPYSVPERHVLDVMYAVPDLTIPTGQCQQALRVRHLRRQARQRVAHDLVSLSSSPPRPARSSAPASGAAAPPARARCLRSSSAACPTAAGSRHAMRRRRGRRRGRRSRAAPSVDSPSRSRDSRRPPRTRVRSRAGPAPRATGLLNVN